MMLQLFLVLCVSFRVASQCTTGPKLTTDSNGLTADLGCRNSFSIKIDGKPDVELATIPEEMENLKQDMNTKLMNLENSIVDSLSALKNETMQKNDELIDETNKKMNNLTSIINEATQKTAKLDDDVDDLKERLANLEACNAKSKILGSDGKCQAPETVTCKEFNYSLVPPTRTYISLNDVARVHSRIRMPCKYDNEGRYFHTRESVAMVNCTGDGEWTDPSKVSACAKVAECNEGKFMSVIPNMERNAECKNCPSGTFQSKKNTSVSKCTPWSNCNTAGKWQKAAGSAAKDRDCGDCTKETGPNSVCNKQLVQSSCAASSEYSGGYRCSNAIAGRGGDWATRHQGAGSWIRFDMNKKVYTKKMYFVQRGCSCEWYRYVTLEFDTGEKRSVELPRSRSATVTFPAAGPFKRVYLRFGSVWSRTNNGASDIRFYGWEEA